MRLVRRYFPIGNFDNFDFFQKEKKSSEEESVLSGHRSIGDDEDYFHDLPSAEETQGSTPYLTFILN